MSKGLGKLQRDILTHLKDPLLEKVGTTYAGETTAYGTTFLLGADVYDLHNVAVILERLYGRSMFNRHILQAAFSRAVRSLLRRGVLERVSLVPVAKECFQWRRDPRWRVEELSDGRYLLWRDRQARFVRLCSEDTTLILAKDLGEMNHDQQQAA
jgi:hypothetical protein